MDKILITATITYEVDGIFTDETATGEKNDIIDALFSYGFDEVDNLEVAVDAFVSTGIEE